MEILKQGKVKRCKDSMKCDKTVSDNNKRCTVNDFIFACSFIYLFIFYFCQNPLIVTSDVIICTGYKIFANTLNL